LKVVDRIALAFLMLASFGALAEDFPSRSIRVVIPQVPGGANDALGRLTAQKPGEKWGKTLFVESRIGARGNIGTNFVAKAAPDGHTWLVTYAGSLAINPAVFQQLPFDTERALETAATIAPVPLVLVTNVDLPAKDLRSLIALAKEEPGGIAYGAQNGAINHLLGVMFGRAVGASTLQVPHRGAADVLNDRMGGRLQYHFASLPSIVGHVKSGRVRALAVTGATRSPAMPEVPTMAELGYPTLTVDAWYGILVPSGVPSSLVAMINAGVSEILEAKAVVEQLAAMGVTPLVTTPAQFKKIASDDLAKWRIVTKDALIKIQQVQSCCTST